MDKILLLAMSAIVPAIFAVPHAHSQQNRPSGTVVGWGEFVLPYVAPGTRFASVAAGEVHSIALTSDGSVVTWGPWDSGRPVEVPLAAKREVAAVAAGASHSVALKTDGSVVAWGWNQNGQTNVPLAASSGVVSIAAGHAHTVALKNDGTVVAWVGSPGTELEFAL